LGYLSGNRDCGRRVRRQTARDLHLKKERRTFWCSLFSRHSAPNNNTQITYTRESSSLLLFLLLCIDIRLKSDENFSIGRASLIVGRAEISHALLSDKRVRVEICVILVASSPRAQKKFTSNIHLSEIMYFQRYNFF